MAEQSSSFIDDFAGVNKRIPKGIGKSLKEGFHKPTSFQGLMNAGTAGGMSGVFGTIAAMRETAELKASKETAEANQKLEKEQAELNARNAEIKQNAMNAAREDALRRARSTPGRPLLTTLNNSSKSLLG